MSSRSNVLVVCVHNAGRSQMAAGIDITGQVPRKLEWETAESFDVIKSRVEALPHSLGEVEHGERGGQDAEQEPQRGLG